MIKTFSKPGTERTLLNLIRGISLKRARARTHTHTHTHTDVLGTLLRHYFKSDTVV